MYITTDYIYPKDQLMTNQEYITTNCTSVLYTDNMYDMYLHVSHMYMYMYMQSRRVRWTHIMVGSSQLQYPLLPVTLLSEKFVDFIVQVSDTKLSKTG